MSDEALTHTVQFSRKVSDGNYGSKEASIFVQFNTAPDADGAAVVEAANGAFTAAMAVVFDRVGIAYDMDEDGNVIEIVDVQAATTPARIEREFAAPPPSTGGGGGESVPSAPPFDRFTKDKGERAQNTAWARARHATHPDEFWDNTSKTDWNGPTYTHKESRVGYWVN